MLKIQHAAIEDIPVWFEYDAHISPEELRLKIACKRAFVLKSGGAPVGVMRYNLFWDNLPFLTMIHLGESAQGRGYGRQAMQYWENEMRDAGFSCVMTSTQVDDTAQHFYRKLGYRDTGCLLLDLPSVAQPAELFLIKGL